MYFVQRDADGLIESVFTKERDDATEVLPRNHPDILNFLLGSGAPDSTGENWLHKDLAMVRVLEDVIDLLVQTDVISFANLPIEAQQKLMFRRGKRNDFGYVASLYPSGVEDELGD